MTHRKAGIKSTPGSGIPCAGLLLGLQECCGFSLRMMPAWNDVTVEYLVRTSCWSLVVTHKYRSFSVWKIRGQGFLGGSRQLLPSVFPAWLSAMKTAGVVLALLLHFWRICFYFFFSLGLCANKLRQDPLGWFSPSKGWIQSWRIQGGTCVILMGTKRKILQGWRKSRRNLLHWGLSG